MMNGMLLPVHRRAELKDEFFYNNFQEGRNFVYKSKVKDMKVTEGAGYRPEPKCMWSEAVTVYGNIVQQSRRDIQPTVLGKSLYDTSPTQHHLAVTASTWSGMNRKERERHLAKLGTSITGDIEEHNKEEPLTQKEVIGFQRLRSPRISDRFLDKCKQNCPVQWYLFLPKRQQPKDSHILIQPTLPHCPDSRKKISLCRLPKLQRMQNLCSYLGGSTSPWHVL